jgi:predicted nucleic acid-binding Zn finger protein
MTQEQRIELEPVQIGEELWSVNGWLTDGDSCACPDYTHKGGGSCKHTYSVLIAEAREYARAS